MLYAGPDRYQELGQLNNTRACIRGLIRGAGPLKKGSNRNGGGEARKAPDTKVPPPMKMEEESKWARGASSTPLLEEREKSWKPLATSLWRVKP